MKPKHYEFPIPFNPLLTNIESSTDAAILESSLHKMNATTDDFTVKIGNFEADLNPYTGFKIKASADLKYDATPFVEQVGKTMGEYLPLFTRSSVIGNFIKQVLTENDINLNVVVDSVELLGPQAGGQVRYGCGGAGFGFNAGLAGIKLQLGLNTDSKKYFLSISRMLGTNATLMARIPGMPNNQSKAVDKISSVAIKNEIGLYGYKLSFGTISKPNNALPALIASTPPKPSIPKILTREQHLPAKASTSTTMHHAYYNDIYSRLSVIKNNQASSSEKVSLVLSEIRNAYKTINTQTILLQKRENEAIVRANFQGVFDGFNLISQIGQTTGNKGIEKFGMAGLSIAQGTYGIAELTGTLGLTQVTSWGVISPYAMIAAAAFNLSSMIFKFGNKKKKKQAKAQQKAFQQISAQIVQVHNDLNVLNNNIGKGFQATAEGLEIINKNMGQGFISLHETMHHYFSKMGEMVSKHYVNLAIGIEKGVERLLDNQAALFDFLASEFTDINFRFDVEDLQLTKMDGKLNQILSILQQLGLKPAIEQRQTMYELIERYQVTKKDKTLIKLLQSIKKALLSARDPLKKLSPQGNNLSGWYHLHHIDTVLQDLSFHQFPFDFANLLNLDWASSALECLSELMPHLVNIESENSTIKQSLTDIFKLLKNTVKPTADAISTLANDTFLQTFFNYHLDKLMAIEKNAEAILRPFRDELGLQGMQNYVQKCMDLDSATPNLIEARQQAITDNTHHMAAQISNNTLRALEKLVIEYNDCIENLKVTTGILFNLLEIETQTAENIIHKIAGLAPIHEHHYRSKGVIKVPGATIYSYLDIDTVNHFKSFTITPDDLAPVITEAASFAESTLSYLNMVANFTDLKLIENEYVFIPAEPLTFHHVNFKGIESTMKIKLKPEENTQTLALIKSVSEKTLEARNKSVVYVMGVSGDGKSTLLNDINGSRYGVDVVNGDIAPKWDTQSSPEICKVGTNISQSETIYPQLIDIIYEGQTLTYCDLPGFEGSRERALTVCEAYTPMILNSEVKDIRGIVWVLSDLHFKTTRAKEVKEVLSYLLKIAKNNPDTIANALTIVVTKGSDYLTKEHVITKLGLAVEGMQDSDEKNLLKRILIAIDINDTSRIIVSRLFDKDSTYRADIHKAILSQPVSNKDTFDFSLYSQTQEDFKRQIDKALNHKQEVLTESTIATLEGDKCKALLNAKTASVNQLKTTQEQKQAELSNIKTQILAQQIKSRDLQTQITALECSNETVTVGNLKHHIAGQTHPVEIGEATGEYTYKETGQVENYTKETIGLVGYAKKTETIIWPGPGAYAHTHHGTARRNLESALAGFRHGKYEIQQVSDPHHNSHVQIIATKVADDLTKPISGTVLVPDTRPIKVLVPVIRKSIINSPIPFGNKLAYVVSYPFDTPIEVTINDASGWSIKPGSEQKNTGYHATIIYEQGTGCTIDIDFKVAKKHSPEGCALLLKKQTEKNQIDRDIVTLNQLSGQLEAEIRQINEAVLALEQQIPVLVEETSRLEEDSQRFNAYLEENQPYFDTLEKLNQMINQKPPLSPRLSDNRYYLHQDTSLSKGNSDAVMALNHSTSKH